MKILSTEISRATQKIMVKAILLEDLFPLFGEQSSFLQSNVDKLVDYIIDDFVGKDMFRMDDIVKYLYDYLEYKNRCCSPYNIREAMLTPVEPTMEVIFKVYKVEIQREEYDIEETLVATFTSLEDAKNFVDDKEISIQSDEDKRENTFYTIQLDILD